MQTLSINRTLPASKFPEPADAYFCDKCGRNITEHLHAGRAHVWRPLGPSRYVCRCGERYISGAVEWDELSEWERQQRRRQMLGLGILMAIPIIGFFFLLRAAIEKHSIALLVACVAVAVPLIVFVILFTSIGVDWIDVVASLWRTRVTRVWRRP